MNKRALNGLYSLTEWITRFAYLNLLWIGFTAIGIFLLGFFPATISMFTIIRKWIIGDPDITIYSTFRDTYKKEFWKSNLFGLMIILLVGLIWLDLHYVIAGGEQLMVELTAIPLLLIVCALIMTTLYLVPVYVHYDVPFKQMLKNAFFIMLVNPIPNLVLLVGIASTLLVMKALPGLLVFFGASFLAAVIMASCYLAFQKVKNRQKKTQST